MKHCKKHNQEYEDYLKECPICVGELLKGTMIERIILVKENEDEMD